MKVAILVPRRRGFPDRDRLWAFARTWWANDFPDWPIIEGHHEEHEGPFNRSRAINRAAALAGDWDAAVIIDADVLCDPHAVRHAVDLAVQSNGPVLAYHERGQLSRQGTEKVMDGYTGSWRPLVKVKSTYGGFLYDACSSAVCVSRPLWDAVGGFDETFVGWGWEDVAFRVACETVSGRDMAKIASTAWHLWHVVSSGNNKAEPTFQANRARGERYREARWDRAGIDALLAEAGQNRTPLPAPVPPATRTIPRILHRTVPAETSPEVDQWWDAWRDLHPGWTLMEHRDPLDPADWDTAHLWDKCKTGAQKAGLIRLECLQRWGGVYVDSDVEPYRSLDPLLACEGFAGWEDAKVVPDAVMGARKDHPAVARMLAAACRAVEQGKGAWDSGPGVTTSILPGRHDWLLLPPGSFYPYHYSSKDRDRRDYRDEQPWAFAAHHWHASWVGK